MTTTWLEVPVPAGDVEEITFAATTLRSLARDTHEGVQQLQRIGQSLDGRWSGEAARAFEAKRLAAGEAVELLAGVEREAARLLDEYAREWEHADGLAHRGHADIERAVEHYLRTASDGLGRVVEQLGGWLSSAASTVLRTALDVVETVASPFVGDVERALQRVMGWTPPAARPTLLSAARPLTVDGVQAGEVLQALRAGGDWAVSHLLDAARGVAHVVGHGLQASVDALDEAEQALAATVASVRRRVRDAMRALWDAGRRTARALEELVVDATTAVFQAVRTAVAAGARFVRVAGAEVLHTVRVAQDAAVAVGAAVLEGLGALDGGRRMRDPAAADRAALQRYYTDDDFRRRAAVAAQLARSAYGAADPPEGWEALETVQFWDGFSATVYRNAAGETVIAYRGTEPTHPNDLGEDLANGLLQVPTPQALRAIALAERYPGATLTGHSLGGGLAAMASMATGQEAFTFNAAGVGNGNLALTLARGGKGLAETQITNFYTGGDPLTDVQRQLQLNEAAGAHVQIASNDAGLLGNHSIDRFQDMGPTPAATGTR